MESTNHTIEEILSQPHAWEDALVELEKFQRIITNNKPKNANTEVVFTGCGSTYYLAKAAAAITQRMTGNCARAFPASELWLNPESSYSNQPVELIAISRSGETTETIRACEMFLKEDRGNLTTLCCYDGKPLAGMGRVNIVLPSGREKSVAQTRAFSVLLLGAIYLSSNWANDQICLSDLKKLPELGKENFSKYETIAKNIGSDKSIDRFYWLGSGPKYGLASELSLKMKEMSLTHSEPFHFLEFRHGPKSMVTSGTQVIGLTSSENYENELQVLKEVEGLGGKTLNMINYLADNIEDSEINSDALNILYLPIGQLIGYYRAISKGLDPDHPNNLDTVVKISE